MSIGYGNGPSVTFPGLVRVRYTVAPLTNVSSGIVRITIVTRSSSVGRSGLHSTERLSSNTGEGHTARAGCGGTSRAAARRATHPTRTNPSRISHPHGDFLPGAELQAVPDRVRDPDAREPREEVARVREVHDGEARRGRGWGRHGWRR